MHKMSSGAERLTKEKLLLKHMLQIKFIQYVYKQERCYRPSCHMDKND